jgi:hypothetical protein
MLTTTVFDEPYCELCGALVITCCPKCNRPIKGESANTIFAASPSKPPAYCPECGQPYPWTERALSSAVALIYETECLELEDRERLVSALPDISAETPNTQLAVTRIKRILTKVGNAGDEVIRSILAGITCEAVKVLLGWS